MKHGVWAAMALVMMVITYRWSYQYEDWRAWALASITGVSALVAVKLTVSAAKRGE